MSERIARIDADGLCTLLLDRPDKLNALDTLAFEELAAHLDDIARSPAIGCVVLRGAGRGFSAGADLDAIGKAPIDPRFKPGVIERLALLPQPVVAAVHGVCLTGGLELVLACDLVVADATARFADTHGRWGLVAAWGMTQRLPRRVGAATAKRLMMTAREVHADEAERIGLVDVLVPAGRLDEAAADLAAAILANSWHTNRAVKRLMLETDGMSLRQGLAHEQDRYPGNASDHEERIARFRKR